jgi:hypothetical protein
MLFLSAQLLPHVKLTISGSVCLLELLKKSLFLFLLLAYAVIFMIEMPNRHLYTSSHILLIDVLHMYELLANLSYGMPHACLLYLCLLSVYLYFIVNSTVLCFFFIRSSQLNYILCGVPNGRRLI